MHVHNIRICAFHEPAEIEKKPDHVSRTKNLSMQQTLKAPCQDLDPLVLTGRCCGHELGHPFQSCPALAQQEHFVSAVGEATHAVHDMIAPGRANGEDSQGTTRHAHAYPACLKAVRRPSMTSRHHSSSIISTNTRLPMSSLPD